MNKKKYFIIYTLIFAVMAVIIYLPFYLTGKSFVWNADTKDGLVQHYNALMYYGKALREIARTLLHDHRLSLPEYSFSLGMGSDVLRTLHYYVIGDPLNLLAVIVPSAKIYQLYSALIIMRMYLAGVCFSVFAIGHGHKNTPALLAGSMVYTFCGFALFAGVRHPFFLNPMIYLPLILLGVHIYLEKKRPYLYIISVAVAALSNFYFLYMIAIVTAVYIVLTLIETCRDNAKKFVSSLIALILFSALSAAMAAVILIPVVSSVLGDSRVNGGSLIRKMYSVSYYKGFAAQFVGYGTMGVWTFMAFGLLALAVVFLMYRRKGNIKLKILFAVCVISMLWPYAGHVMNGFSYSVNRWCFAFSLLCAYILVKMWPDLFSLTRREKIILTVFLTLYTCLAFLIKPADSVPAFGMACGLGFAGLLLAFMTGRESIVNRRLQYAVTGMVMLSVLCNGYYCYNPDQSELLEEYCDTSYVSEIAHWRYPDLTVIKQQALNGESLLSRYSGSGFIRNSSLRYGTSTTQYFWSLSNPYIARYRTDLLLSEDKPQAYTGFDDSTFLNALAGVAYHVIRDENLVPYGYEKAAEAGTQLIYHNKYALPLLYAYDSYYTHKDFDSLTAVQKAEAMMQGVLLETEEPELKRADPVLTSHEIGYEIKSREDGKITFRNNTFSAPVPNNPVTIQVSGEPGTETILYLEGPSFKGYTELSLYGDDPAIDPENRFTSDQYAKLSVLEQRKLKKTAASYYEPVKYTLQVVVKREDGSTVEKKIMLTTPYYEWYTGRKAYTLNLGYSEKAVKEVAITFPYRGTYSFDKISFISQPLSGYEDQVRKLAENSGTDIRFRENEFTAKIHLDQTELVCMAIPYDKGWTAYADGKQMELMQANTAYMGIVLRAGDHDIRLVYHTPYLRTGALISAAGCIVFIILIAVCRYRKKRLSAD